MPEVSNALMVGIGLGTVFFGLICLIFICFLMSKICMLLEKGHKETSNNQQAEVKPAVTAVNGPIANKQEILAAACAVIAEELGTEANNIKVLSFKRV